MIIHLLPLLLAACSTGSVPRALMGIEGDAEDAYDKALVEDYVSTAADAESIAGTWAGYRDQALADGASEATASALDAAIDELATAADAGESAVAVGRAANAISAPIPDLFDLYAPRVPSDILALDYKGREVVLDGMELDFGAAVADVEALAAVWDGVKQQVVDAGGQAEADDFDTSVATLQALAAGDDTQALIDEANVNLELVDVLEGVFGG